MQEAILIESGRRDKMIIRGGRGLVLAWLEMKGGAQRYQRGRRTPPLE